MCRLNCLRSTVVQFVLGSRLSGGPRLKGKENRGFPCEHELRKDGRWCHTGAVEGRYWVCQNPWEGRPGLPWMEGEAVLHWWVLCYIRLYRAWSRARGRLRAPSGWGRCWGTVSRRVHWFCWVGSCPPALRTFPLFFVGRVRCRHWGSRPFGRPPYRKWISSSHKLVGYFSCTRISCATRESVEHFTEMGLRIWMVLKKCGWWFGTNMFYFSIQLGISSSQLTNSYFSEG